MATCKESSASHQLRENSKEHRTPRTLRSVFRLSRDSKSCCSTSSRQMKKSVRPESIRSSSLRLSQSKQKLHRDPTPTKAQRADPADYTSLVKTPAKRSLSKSSKSPHSRSSKLDGEKRSPPSNSGKCLDKKRSRSASCSRTHKSQLRSHGERSESTRSLKSNTGSSTSTGSKVVREEKQMKARSKSCDGRKASPPQQQRRLSGLSTSHEERRNRSYDGRTLETSGQSTCSRQTSSVRKEFKRSNSGMERGIDPPSTRPILDKSRKPALSYSNVYSPARNQPSAISSKSSKSSNRTRSLSLDKGIRSSKRSTEKSQPARRPGVRTPKSASERTIRKLAHPISASPCRKPASPFSPNSGNSSRKSTASTKSVSSGRSIQTAQDSLSMIDTSSLSKRSTLTMMHRDRKLYHSKSCTGADLLRSVETPIEDSPLASNKPLK